MAKQGLKLDQLDILDETGFEEFCLEVLGSLGFVNVDLLSVAGGSRVGPALRDAAAA